MPRPPYSRGVLTPNNPSSPRRFRSGFGTTPERSTSSSCGESSVSTKRRTRCLHAVRSGDSRKSTRSGARSARRRLLLRHLPLQLLRREPHDVLVLVRVDPERLRARVVEREPPRQDVRLPPLVLGLPRVELR